MSEQQFDSRLTRELGAYADSAVRPVDVDRLVDISVRRKRTRFGPRSPYAWLAAAALVTLLLLAVLFAIGPGSTRFLASVEPSPSPPAEPPTAIPDLTGSTWLTDQPARQSFEGEAGQRRLTLAFGSGGTVSVRTTAFPFFPSTVTIAADVLSLTSTAPGSSVVSDGRNLAGCATGDVGQFRASTSPDRMLLTLVPIHDACVARPVVLGRTWARSLTAESLGGPGIVNAFEPRFAVTLPAGPFSAARTSDAVEITAADGSVSLLAWKDPQGFKDPCDFGAGRYEVAPGADAFVAYFRQNPAFTVVSTEELEIDGHRAVRLVIDARTDHPCPAGFAIQWQPRAETSDLSWHLLPGDRDSLYLVELPDVTAMFEVLPLQPTERSIIDSITFPDTVPPSP